MVGCQPDRARRTAVVRVPERDDVRVAGEEACHRDGQVVRFTAAVDEVGDIQSRRHLRSELLGQEREVWMEIDRGGMLKRRGLGLHPADDLRVAVAAGYRD